MIEFTPTPVLISIGPLAIRYYSLAYLSGFVAAWYLLSKSSFREHADDLTLWIALGVILGGRMGYVVFYAPSLLWTDFLEIFAIWRGGMSFHGGLLGCITAVALYVRSRKLAFFALADIITLPALIGLVLGRIANFLNGELVGTVTNVPWCVVIDSITGCRHPSPLYEAMYSAAILLVVSILLWRKAHGKLQLPDGAVFGVFLVLYGVFRTVTNIWREDPRWFLGLGTGQWLSILTLVLGTGLLVWLHRNAHKPRAMRKRR
jgi:phosphatidylglycerol:prolipoprotein diacylglycerol transferase